jgi:signal transduction histidine kinase
MSSIQIINGVQKGKQYEVARGIATIGRDQTNTIQLTDTEVSRRHAEIHFHGTDFTICDMTSSNGTFVNGDRVTTKRLDSGDVIQLGQTQLIFLAEEELDPGQVNPTADTVHENLPPRNPTFTSPQEYDVDSELSVKTADWIARAKSNLQVMFQAALVSTDYQDIDSLVQRILDLVFTWISADRACVLLNRQGDCDFHDRIYRRISGKEIDKRPFPISQSLVRYVLKFDEGVLSHDVSTDSRFVRTESIDGLGSREVICVPIRSRSGIRGLIYADRPSASAAFDWNTSVSQNAIDEEQLKLLIAIGHQAAIAIENADYYAMMLRLERATAVGRVMKTLSHHIKNILQGINGGAHLIESGLESKKLEAVENGWMMVRRNQEDISNLVMDMLTYSEPTTPRLRPVDLNAMLQRIGNSLQRRAEMLGVAIEYAGNTELPPLNCDPDLILRALASVVSSAMNSCRDKPNGKVKIRCFYQELSSHFKIVISDNGINISESELATLFDPLSLNEFTNRMGIGMAVAEKSVIAHNGKINAQKNENGPGTTYVLKIPRFPDVSAKDMPTQKGQERPAS